jgi:hypothetical protein
VRAALIEKGVSPDDVRAGSLGEEVLAVDTQKAEPKNRRVQIVVRRRRMDFGMVSATAKTVTPVKQGGAAEKKTPEAKAEEESEEQQAADRRAEFEQKIRDLAVEKGAAKETLFDEAVKYLARNAAPDTS